MKIITDLGTVQRGEYRRHMVVVRCACGYEFAANAYDVKSGHTRSCRKARGGCPLIDGVREEPYFNKAQGTWAVPLSGGMIAVVDAADFQRVSSRRWKLARRKSINYAESRNKSSRENIMLHVFLTGWRYADHRNGDGLDNRRSNLRQSTVSQQRANARRKSDNTSGFKGVYWSERNGAYVGRIQCVRKTYHLGLFRSASAAGKAYDDAARKHFGSFACLNFPRHGERGCRT